MSEALYRWRNSPALLLLTIVVGFVLVAYGLLGEFPDGALWVTQPIVGGFGVGFVVGPAIGLYRLRRNGENDPTRRI